MTKNKSNKTQEYKIYTHNRQIFSHPEVPQYMVKLFLNPQIKDLNAKK